MIRTLGMTFGLVFGADDRKAKAEREPTRRWKSSGGPDDGNPELNGKGTAATRCREEAIGIVPARGTRTAYEATAGGRGGESTRSPKSSGTERA